MTLPTPINPARLTTSAVGIAIAIIGPSLNGLMGAARR
jgi:hypothetical protein